jgi:hypothetical protein
MGAMVWATALQASRDLLQGSTLTLLFVAAGGNLAPCVLASFANQVAFAALVRLGDMRLRKVGAQEDLFTSTTSTIMMIVYGGTSRAHMCLFFYLLHTHSHASFTEDGCTGQGVGGDHGTCQGTGGT